MSKKIHSNHRGRKAVLAVLVTICILAGALAAYVLRTVKPYQIDLDKIKLELSGPSDAVSTEAIADLKNSATHVWVDLSHVPKNLTDAIISTEDKDFYQNSGVDYLTTLKAAANEVLHFDENVGGGSTITQQVVKNVEGNINNRTYKIKLKEIITALNITKQYSKNQILEMYINIATFGNGCYGVQAASLLYFGKDVSALDLVQCATLASILPSPNLTFNPYKSPENVRNRRNIVLKNMLVQGMISNDQYAEAIRKTVTYVPAE